MAALIILKELNNSSLQEHAFSSMFCASNTRHEGKRIPTQLRLTQLSARPYYLPKAVSITNTEIRPNIAATAAGGIFRTKTLL